MLHVLEIETNSPAELAGLVPFKDYLLGTAEKVHYTFFLCLLECHKGVVYLSLIP